MSKIIVLAGNREQFERYLSEQGLTDSEAVYGYEPHSILGIRANKVVEIGTFWETKNANKLWTLAQSRVI